MLWLSKIPRNRHRVLVAMALVALAAGLRVWPLHALGSILAWLTFYPAVAIAAAYGGFAVGLGTAVASALTALFMWPFLVAAPFIQTTADWIGLWVFVVNCALIAWIAEAMLRAQEHARLAQQQAEESNRSKSVFLANMSHELRTPLNAILGFSNLMRNEAGISESHRKTLDLINRSGEHLLGLINDVLDMSKIEAGRMELENQPFDVAALLREVADLMRIRALEKSLSLQLVMPSAMPRWLMGDAAKLRQAIINLVGNAIKFTDHGGVTLRLKYGEPDSEPSGISVFEVEDTGIGIADEDQSRVFEPFVQVSGAAASKGTGLGLAITAKNVETMGGHISVKSTPGIGSVFRIEIPLDESTNGEGAQANQPQGRIVSLAAGQHAHRVLIVEDQMENWLLLQRMLEEVGFMVEVAQDGLQGVVAFESWHPDFIWMDLRMPVLDGFEATRRIRDLPGGTSVRIAALTASAFREEREQVMQAGMDDFVRKPYRPEDIFSCLARHLGVTYTYAQDPTPAQDPLSGVLTGEALSVIDAGLRQQLHQALLQLDMAQVGELISQVQEGYPDVGQMLKTSSDQLAYSSMVRALESCANGAAQGVAP